MVSPQFREVELLIARSVVLRWVLAWVPRLHFKLINSVLHHCLRDIKASVVILDERGDGLPYVQSFVVEVVHFECKTGHWADLICRCRRAGVANHEILPHLIKRILRCML